MPDDFSLLSDANAQNDDFPDFTALIDFAVDPAADEGHDPFADPRNASEQDSTTVQNDSVSDALQSVATSLGFLAHFIAQNALGPLHGVCEFVRMDQGELFCKEVIELHEHCDCTVEPTSADSSNQNGCVESEICLIAEGIRAMLKGAALASKFWPFALHQHVRVWNLTIHKGFTKSPCAIGAGNGPATECLATRTSMLLNSFVGTFLVTTAPCGMLSAVMSLPRRSSSPQHLEFDEAFTDLSLDSRPPDVLLLLAANHICSYPVETEDTESPELGFAHNACADLLDVPVT